MGRRYLLDKNDIRPYARLLRGDPAEVVEVAESLPPSQKQKHTVGVLSFAEANIAEELKFQLMDGFEKVLLADLDQSQYCIYWAEHLDKGRLELNYCIAHVELASGKELTPYFDRADRPRVNAWLDIINITHNFADPKDPSREQDFKFSRNLPKGKRQTHELIGEAVKEGIEAGTIEYRRDVIKLIKKLGYVIVSEKPSSISIRPKSSDPDTIPVRLKGGYYESTLDKSEGYIQRAEAKQREYESTESQRLAAAMSTLERLMRIKCDRYIVRYGTIGESDFRCAQPSAANSHELSDAGSGTERSDRSAQKNGLDPRRAKTSTTNSRELSGAGSGAEHSDRAAQTIDLEPRSHPDGKCENIAEESNLIPHQSNLSAARDTGSSTYQIERDSPYERLDPFRASAHASCARTTASARNMRDRLRAAEHSNSAAAIQRDQERARAKFNTNTSYPFVAVAGRIRAAVAAISTFVKFAKSTIVRFIKQRVALEEAQSLIAKARAQEVVNARIRPVLDRLMKVVERKLNGDKALSSTGRAWKVMFSNYANQNPELTRLREQFLLFFEIEREKKRSNIHLNVELEAKKEKAILDFFDFHADPQKLESFSQSLMQVEVSADVYDLPLVRNDMPRIPSRSPEPRKSRDNDNDFGMR